MKENYLSNQNDGFQQNDQIIFDFSSKLNLFSQHSINLEINHPINLTKTEIVFKIYNVTNLKLDLFFTPHFYFKNYNKNITTIDKIKILNFAPKTRIFIHRDFFVSLNCTKFEITNLNKYFSLRITLNSSSEIKSDTIRILILDNIKFNQVPIFFLPHINFVIMKSVYFLAENKSMFELDCKSRHLKSIFNQNQNISVYSNGQKCFNNLWTCNQCDHLAFKDFKLQKRTDLSDISPSQNKTLSELEKLDKLYYYFSNDFLIFFALISTIVVIYIIMGIFYFKKKKVKKNFESKNNVNMLRNSVTSEASINRRSMQRHQFAVENLNKRPSKSILITPERKSQILENRMSALNKIGFESNRESNSFDNRLSVNDPHIYQNLDYDNRNSIRDSCSIRLSNFNGEDNRKSMSSLKSVTFNEKTQVRRVKKLRLN